MLATTLGVDFDADKAYDERREIYMMSGQIVDSASAPCVTTGQAGLWTTTLSAVVFIP
jgi:arginine decarboxylase